VDVPIVIDGLVTLCGEEANSETVVSVKRFQLNVRWNLSFGPLTYIQKVLYMSWGKRCKTFEKYLAGCSWFRSRLSASSCSWATNDCKQRNYLPHKTLLTAFVFCCWCDSTSAWGVLLRSWINKERYCISDITGTRAVDICKLKPSHCLPTSEAWAGVCRSVGENQPWVLALSLTQPSGCSILCAGAPVILPGSL
jgi:hypothetical protein